jgi:hypothetical protein
MPVLVFTVTKLGNVSAATLHLCNLEKHQHSLCVKPISILNDPGHVGELVVLRNIELRDDRFQLIPFFRVRKMGHKAVRD